jgi:hypothetical protein
MGARDDGFLVSPPGVSRFLRAGFVFAENKTRRNRCFDCCDSGALKSLERGLRRSRVCLYLYRPWSFSYHLFSCHPLPACSACLTAWPRAEAVPDEPAAVLPALAGPVAAPVLLVECYRQEAALLPADDCRQVAVASLLVARACPAAQLVCWHRAELARDEPAAADSYSAAVARRPAVLLAALPGEHSNFRSAGSHRYRQVSPEAQAGRVRSAAREPVAANWPRAALQGPARAPVLQFRSAEAAGRGDCRYYSLAARRLHAPAAQFSPQELERRKHLSLALPCELC